MEKGSRSAARKEGAMARHDGADNVLELEIGPLETGQAHDGHQPLLLATSRGAIEMHYYPAAGAQRAAVWVGGVGGGFDSPARGLYPRLAADLQDQGIASLRVRYRHPTVLLEATLDVLAGLHVLAQMGIDGAGLVGHSFGGAVVIQAAAQMPMVRTVVALATQSYGTGPVANLAPRCSLLLVHGDADRVLSAACAEYVYALAGGSRRLEILSGVDHGLDEAADQVYALVRSWLLQELLSISTVGSN